MSAELIADFHRTIIDGLMSKSLTTCSRWSAYRRLMGEPFPGKYSWKYHPWVKDMLDSEAGFNCAMKSAQVGVTEVGINRAFYVIDRLKRDVLYVLPTAQIASDFSKARFTGALKLSPYLESIFTDVNTVNLKQAGSNNLYIRGSRGESNLVSIPVSELILDEVDRMDQEAIHLALERLSGQLRKCVWAISTPTLPNFGIHKLYQKTTQERFVFECPSCSHWTELVWPDCIQICGEAIYDPKIKESYLKCKECKNKLHHEDKPNFLSKARWQVFNKNADPDRRGFYINQLYSFTVKPWELVEAYFSGLGDEGAAKKFHTEKLGLPFIGDGAQITDDMLKQCVGSHTTNDPRPRVGGQRLITLGIDQGKTSYWVVCEWLVDQLGFDINVAAQCKILAFGTFPESDWGIIRQLMREWQVLACVIDADPQINEARRFAKEYPGYVYLCRYRRGKTAKEIAISEEETGAPMATVDRTNWLTASLGRFRTQRVVMPADVSHEFKEHMKSLVRTYEDDEVGNPVATFVKVGAADHFAHAFNYAEIALPLAASITTGTDVEKFL